MPGRRLGAVVHYLRRITGAPDQAEATDGQLLEHFLRTRDESAFTMLVRRHGPMVLRVCRNVLGDAHDTEDAFQATFLVLVRKAGSLGRPELLGNWLFGVAHRVAVKARSARVRRQQREQQGMEMNTLGVETEIDDVGRVLLEEVQRLPARYRVPVVLCYLEGKTKRKASQHLGWPEGTVATRLSRARELLRGRLTRRGVVLSAGAFATVLGAATAPAAVPAALLQSTVQIGLLVAAGTTAAGLVSANAIALTEGVLKAMIVAKLKVVAVVLLTIGLAGTGAWAVAYQRQAPVSNAGTGQPVARAEPRQGPTSEEEPPEEKTPADKMVVTGLVKGEQGRPIAEAGVVVLANPVHHDFQKMVKPLKLGTTKTDAEGRFRVETPRLTPQEHSSAWVLVGAKGHSMGWQGLADWQQPVARKARHEVTVQLPGDQLIRGRILDLQGQPVQGVRVNLESAMKHVKDPKEGMPVRRPPEDVSVWPSTAVTDAQGRFSLGGVGPGLYVRLQLRDDRYTPEDWEVDLAAKPANEEISRTLAPARIIAGQVTYADTKKPVPHAQLFVDSYRNVDGRHFTNGTADENGRFRLVPYAGDLYSISALAPEGEPYLSRQNGLSAWPKAGALKQEINLALPRGILLHGKIIEEVSGQPVSGALLGYWLQRKDNPYLAKGVDIGEDGFGRLHVKSDANGQFRLAVLPGPGRLLVKGSTPDYIHVETTLGELEGGRPSNQRWYPDALVAFNHKPGSEPPEITVKLRMV